MRLDRTPLVSIVIPTFARPQQLRACLAGIAGLRSHHVPFEVIVVDDASPKRLDAVIAEFRDRLAIRLVTQAHTGPGAARNTGATLANGRYLAFLDDDCVPAPDWLRAMVDELRRDDRRLLGGRVDNALGENPFSDASHRIGRFVYQYYQDGGAQERFFTTNNMALATDLFRSLGGFDTTIPSATAEDKEFCDRWQARSLELAHVPQAVVYHAHALTFSRFLRQHFNYGRGILWFRLAKRRRAGSHFVPEPLKFYVDLVASPLRERGRRRWTASLLICAAQLATIAGALRQAGSSLLGRVPRSEARTPR